ncbi:hypothetical protein SAMN06273572_103221 [Monaibacterium marinum]|uniref:DUF1150 family protein n=1 Tax=Pontivivens marinum TaxID=1690039 RepID=A0A2C9CSG8_9RHOB|nr:DUF1150 family protein [Monaibacterium marinum]SOH94192.1 hypothetical protein SAMN06273572_103221 [Monaibacterium marinum]
MSTNEIQTPDGVQDRTVYVRQVATADLPQEVRDQTKSEMIYAIHDGNGARIALVADRQTAFIVARQNEMAPVSVH